MGSILIILIAGCFVAYVLTLETTKESSSPKETDNSNEMSRFIKAIKAADVATVKDFIKSGASLDKVISDEKTMYPLHEAIAAQNLEIMQLLLDAGASHSQLNDYGSSPLVTAVPRSGSANVDIVRELIARGANYSARDCLVSASKNSTAAMVRFFLEKGANPCEKVPYEAEKTMDFDGDIVGQSELSALAWSVFHYRTFYKEPSKPRIDALEVFLEKNLPISEVIDALGVAIATNHKPGFELLYTVIRTRQDEIESNELLFVRTTLGAFYAALNGAAETFYLAKDKGLISSKLLANEELIHAEGIADAISRRHCSIDKTWAKRIESHNLFISTSLIFKGKADIIGIERAIQAEKDLHLYTERAMQEEKYFRLHTHTIDELVGEFLEMITPGMQNEAQDRIIARLEVNRQAS